MAHDLVALAEVARPHGVRGELRLKLYNRDSDLLQQVKKVVLRRADGTTSTVELREVRRANDALLVRLAGCEDRDQADALRGAQLLVPRSAFPALDEGEYYVCDLIGVRVVAPDGVVGVVEDVLAYPTCDALILRTPDDQKIELPMVDGVVDEVDLSAREIRVPRRDPLEGE